MLLNPTLEKLRALRLTGLAQALEEQRQQTAIAALSFEDRLTLLVERQWLWQENRGLAIRLKNAQFKISASLEDLDYRSSRGLKRAQIEQLRASAWVKEHRNCLITGPTGSGKTYLACAVGAQACREGYRTLYYYAPKFFRALETARADGSLLPLLKKLARAPLILVDDLGIASVPGKLYREFLEMLDDRQGQGATLITSQFPVSQWHEVIADATVADAILDRLVHNAYRIELKGESLRKAKTAPRPSPCPRTLTQVPRLRSPPVLLSGRSSILRGTPTTPATRAGSVGSPPCPAGGVTDAPREFSRLTLAALPVLSPSLTPPRSCAAARLFDSGTWQPAPFR